MLRTIFVLIREVQIQANAFYLKAFNLHSQPQSPHVLPWRYRICNLDHKCLPTQTSGHLYAIGSLKHPSDLCDELPNTMRNDWPQGMKGP